MRTARGELGVAAALAIGSAAYLLPLRRYGFQINDDGWYLHPVLRMLDGEILYRDVWTFYAPLEHHLFTALFRWTGPSLLAARTLWVAILVLAVLAAWSAARRFAPPALAWIPPVVFALVPGQWSKAFYGLGSAVFFALAGWVLARPGPARFAALGFATGATLVTRQDIGLAQLGLGVLLAAGVAAAPARFGLESGAHTRRLAGGVGAFLLAAAPAPLAVAAYYAAHAALAPLVEATLVAAFRQREAWGYGEGLGQMLSPGSFLAVKEGRVAGALLLLPLLLCGLGAGVLLARAWRRRFDAETLLAGALVAYVGAGLLNTLFQLRLLRLLETGVPVYLLFAWLLAVARRALLARGHGAVARAAPLAAALAGALYVGTIAFALPRVELSDDYTGSLRGRRLTHPVEVLGDTVYVDWASAEEYRLVRAFLAPRLASAEPAFAIPLISGYYLLLEQPNPTRVVHVHFRRDASLSDAQKREEVRRLLDSPTRFAVVMHGWLGWPEPPDALRLALYEHFHPVREYGSVAILERNRRPADAALMQVYARVLGGRATAEDRDFLQQLAARRPREPLPQLLLGRVLARQGITDAALAALQEAARLDAANPAPLEEAAEWLWRAGRVAEARAALQTSLATRDNPAAREALARLAAGAS